MWRDIPGAGKRHRYQVSACGQVRNADTGLVLRPQRCSNGYRIVNLGRGSRHLVHRLVAVAFVGGDPALQVNHKNGDRSDNRAENLEWLSCSENHRHSYRELARKQHGSTRRVAVSKGGVSQTFESELAAAQHLGVVPGSVASAVTRNHKCKGHEVFYV